MQKSRQTAYIGLSTAHRPSRVAQRSRLGDSDHTPNTIPSPLPSAVPVSTYFLQTTPSAIATLRHTPDLVQLRVIRPRHSLRAISDVSKHPMVHKPRTYKFTQILRSSTSAFCILKYAAVVIFNKRILQRVPRPLVPDYLSIHDHPKRREYQLQILVSRHQGSGTSSSAIRRESDGGRTGEEGGLLRSGGSGNRSSIQIQSYYLTIIIKKKRTKNNMPDPHILRSACPTSQ
jgi:hypothetical protein